ncbi:hypothetical protein [Pedobacter arcticus]|uniref:hypothetical protein n=1 Tax=Pedobacter arcticus TaxID=752140 RepID=UPI0002DE266A|nr:hypothetical protein [Pedobacter arcticus]
MIAFFFSSCSKEEWEKDCKSNCTTLSGRFVSLNNEPVPNVNVSLSYKISGTFFSSGSSRKIVQIKSDKNGYFKKSFYVKDSELGNGKGYFDFTIDDSPLDISKYIKQDNQNAGGNVIDINISSIYKRDTVINNTYYIPKKNSSM